MNPTDTPTATPSATPTDPIEQLLAKWADDDAPAADAADDETATAAAGEEAEEAEDAAAGEAADAEDAEAADDDARFEIVHNGEVKQLRRAELIELAQKGYDYTHKTQELGEQRRALDSEKSQFESERQAFTQSMQLQGQFIQELAQAHALETSLQQFEAVDWPRVKAEDPDTYAQMREWRRDLIDQRNELKGRLTALQQAAQAEAQQQLRAAQAKLKQAIPDYDTLQPALLSYGEKLGFSPEEVAYTVDPRMIRVLIKAYRYDQLQSGKTAAAKKVAKLPKPVTPNAATAAPSEARQRATDKQARFLRTRSLDDAAELLMDRLS